MEAEVRSSIALKFALVTMTLLVLVGFGGYFLGVGRTLRTQTRTSSTPGNTLPTTFVEPDPAPQTPTGQAPEVLQKLPPPPPSP